MTKTTIKPQTDVAPTAAPIPVSPEAANGHNLSSKGHVPKSLNDPIIPNHPLASLAGAFADEPLWDALQEEIHKYRQRMNEQSDEDD